MKTQAIKKIHIIINPASGKIEPILPIINTVMTQRGLQWEVSVTKKSQDGRLLAQEAVNRKVDAIAVYGGDGTVMEVVSGMMGSHIPLAILPGGTANVLATDLKIPKTLKEACELVCEPSHRIKSIDVGRFNQRYFILRLGLGFEAEMVKGASRETKNKFGLLAYAGSCLEAMKKIKEANYNLTIDGKCYESRGVTCIVANSGNTGFSDLSLDNHINVSDGLLDVVIVRKVNINLLGHVMKTILRHRRSDNIELVQHWQGINISVASRPQQTMICDGEVLDKAPLHAKVIPGACRVIVPGT